jgi:hypothetical protein
LERFLDSIRDKNALVLRREPADYDELYRSEKPL